MIPLAVIALLSLASKSHDLEAAIGLFEVHPSRPWLRTSPVLVPDLCLRAPASCPPSA